jgi:hypothetical protein
MACERAAAGADFDNARRMFTASGLGQAFEDGIANEEVLA